MQFSLRHLLGYITLCCLLASCSGIAGVASSIGLMLFTLALWFRQGVLAMAMLTATMLATRAAVETPQGDFGPGRFLIVTLATCALCGWYAVRRRNRLPVSQLQTGKAHVDVPRGGTYTHSLINRNSALWTP